MVRTQDSHSCNRGSIPRSTTIQIKINMLKINANTTQNSLIEGLINEIIRAGDLYIEVENLPIFLCSIPAIRVFQNKINNYPKSVFWYSQNITIFELLQTSSLKTGFPPTLVDNLYNAPDFNSNIEINQNSFSDNQSWDYQQAEFCDSYDTKPAPTFINFAQNLIQDNSNNQDSKEIDEIELKLKKFKEEILNQTNKAKTTSLHEFVESNFEQKNSSSNNFNNSKTQFSFDNPKYSSSKKEDFVTNIQENKPFENTDNSTFFGAHQTSNDKIEFAVDPKIEASKSENLTPKTQEFKNENINFVHSPDSPKTFESNKNTSNIALKDQNLSNFNFDFSSSFEGNPSNSNFGKENITKYSNIASDQESSFKPKIDSFGINKEIYSENKSQEPNSKNTEQTTQNLEEWMSKVDSIKSNIRGNSDSFDFGTKASSVDDFQFVQKNNSASTKINGSTLTKLFRESSSFLNFSFASVIVVLGFAVFLAWPKITWQIQSSSFPREVAVDLSLDASKMKKYNQKFENSEAVIPSKSATSEASSEILKQTTRSTAIIEFWNNSSNDVNLQQNTFWFEDSKTKFKYYPIWEDKNNNVLTVPSQLQKNPKPIQIKIQAEDFGNNYDLKSGANLSVLKNNNQFVAVDFVAIVKVSNNAQQLIESNQGSNSATLANNSKANSKLELSQLDIDLANQKNWQKIRLEQLKFIDSLKKTGEYSNQNWLINLNQKSEDNTKSESGSYKTIVNTEFFAFEQNKILDELKSQNQLSNITDINLVDTKITANSITSKVYVTFLENSEDSVKKIQKDPSLASSISSSDLDKIKSNLQQSYPSIKQINYQKTGIAIPGIKPISQVNINSN